MKIKILISLIVQFFLVPNSIAQWQWQNPLPSGNSLNDIFFFNQDTGWIVGDFGTLEKTIDGGLTWEMIGIPSNCGLNAIYFTSVQNGFIVDGCGNILKTEDEGDEWIISYEGGSPLNHIFFIDELEGWVVGDSGKIMHSSDGGNTWDIQVDSTLDILSEVYFVSPFTGWIIGNAHQFLLGDHPLLLRTTDGGQHWSRDTLNYTADSWLKGSIYFNDSLNGWISFGSNILQSYDGGASWELSYNAGFSIYDICFTDGENGWVVGGDQQSFSGRDNGYILHTSNSGGDWAVQSTEETWPLNNVYAIDQQTLYSVGITGTIYKTNNGGSDWSLVNPCNRNDLNDVCFVGETEGWAVGLSGTIMHTSDGGITWADQYAGATTDFQSVHFTDSESGFVVGQKNIMHTTNGGLEWDSIALIVDYDLNAVFFSDLLNGWIAGNHGYILHSNDGGLTWNKQNNGYLKDLYDVFFIDAQTGWTVGYDGLILHTSNGGQNWTTQQSGVTSEYLRSVYFIDENNGWISGGLPESIIHTTDGGLSWEIQEYAIYWQRSFESICFTDEFNGWVTGYTSWGVGYPPMYSSVLMYTNDGGANWEEIYPFPYEKLRSIILIDQNKGWMVGDKGTIFYTENGGIVGVKEQTQITHHSSLNIQICPNPTGGISDFGFLISDFGRVRLKIYDMHGQEVAVLLDEKLPAGEHVVRYDASYLPDGIYFVRLQAGIEMATGKIVKLD